MLNKVGAYFLRVIFFSVVVLVGIMLTGAIERSYSVLPLEGPVTIGPKELTLQEVATQYLPGYVLPQGVTQKDLEEILYEVVRNDANTFTINYYFRWTKEIHPDPFLNTLNTLWNLVYYKFNNYDIEYVQLDIDITTGGINQVKFKNGVIDEPSTVPTLQVGGWKHNFQIGNSFSRTNEPSDIPLTYFTEFDYKFFKMARRSQGDFHTPDNPSNIPIIIFLALIATYYFRHVQKDYNNEYDATH